MRELSLEGALVGRPRGLRDGGEVGSSAPNLLLQIVLPVTLILGLVVSTKIHEYNALILDLQGDPFHRKFERAYLELQKQALLRALEEVQQEETDLLRPSLTALEVNAFASRYFKTGAVATGFKERSEKAHDHLAKRRAARERALAGEALARADRVLRDVSALQFRSLRRPRDDPESELQRRELVGLAESRVGEFMQRLLEDAATAQIRLIQAIHARFADDLERLDSWDPQLKELARLYQQSSGPAEKSSYSNAIFQRLHEKIREDFESQGSRLLPRTWEKRGLKMPSAAEGDHRG